MIAWLLALFGCKRLDIGRKGLPDYLTRWTLWDGKCKLFLHHFHRGDAEAVPHDHPWDFWSLILWGGYWEITPVRTRIARLSSRAIAVQPAREGDEEIRWYGPLSLLRRPAEWRHRVVLPGGCKAWTLVWTGPKVRSWGFWCPGSGFLPWRQHQANQDAGLDGCSDPIDQDAPDASWKPPEHLARQQAEVQRSHL